MPGFILIKTHYEYPEPKFAETGVIRSASGLVNR